MIRKLGLWILSFDSKENTVSIKNQISDLGDEKDGTIRHLAEVDYAE